MPYLFPTPDEGAFLYWEFEVKDHRNQEEAEAAMREACAGQEVADCLLLYRGYRAKLPDVSGDPDSARVKTTLLRTEGAESFKCSSSSGRISSTFARPPGDWNMRPIPNAARSRAPS